LYNLRISLFFSGIGWWFVLFVFIHELHGLHELIFYLIARVVGGLSCLFCLGERN